MIKRRPRNIEFIGAQQHFSIEKNETVLVDVICLDNGFGCAGPDSNNEMLTLSLQGSGQQRSPELTNRGFAGTAELMIDIIRSANILDDLSSLN